MLSPQSGRRTEGLKGSEAVFVWLPSAVDSVSELPGVHGRVRAAHPDGPGVPEGPVRDRSPAEQEVSAFKHSNTWPVSNNCQRVRTVGRSPSCCRFRWFCPLVLIVSVQTGAQDGAGAGAEGAADVFSPHPGAHQTAGGQQQPVGLPPGFEEQAGPDPGSEPAPQLITAAGSGPPRHISMLNF